MYFLLSLGMAVLVLFMAAGCAKSPSPQQDMDEEEYERNMASQEITTVLMEECRLSNLDLFWDWALDEDNVEDLEKDANGRMIAFLLMEDFIQADDRAKYGSYIRQDIEEIKTEERYEPIADKTATYAALFDEVSVAKCKTAEDYKQAYIKEWKKRGVVIDGGKAHLICVVVHDPKEKKQYIAQAGVMLEDNEGFLFIEKRARFQRFQISYYVSRQELKDKLLARKDYVTNTRARAPFLLEDMHLME